jgi:hypothetical protein
MKPTVVAPVPGPVEPLGEVQLPAVPTAVAAEPAAVVGVVLAVVDEPELPQAVAQSAIALNSDRALAPVRDRSMG